MGCERVPASAILAHTCCTVQKWMGSHSSTRRTVWLVARSSRENGVIRARLALSWARSPRTLRMRHRGPADSLGDQGRRGRVRGGRRGPRGPGRVPAGPVAVRAPQPGPRSRVSRRPRSGRTATGGIRDGRWSVRGPRQPDRASGCGWPRRDRSAASAAGLCPRTHAPAGALCPAGQADTRTRTGRTGGSSWRTSHGIGEAAREG